jgi:hypothetical protein
VSPDRPHIILPTPPRCTECVGDFTCGKCGRIYVEYVESGVKATRKRALDYQMKNFDLQQQVMDLKNRIAWMGSEAVWQRRDTVPVTAVRDLPAQWRTMQSLTVEDCARELQTIVNEWLERRSSGVELTTTQRKWIARRADLVERMGDPKTKKSALPMLSVQLEVIDEFLADLGVMEG